MCAGSVYYNKGRYERAALHFKKALKFFPADSLAREYLYYTYDFTGNAFEKQRTATKLLATQKQRLGYKLRAVQSVSLSGGYAVSDNNALNGGIALWQPGVINAETRQLNNTGFVQLSMVNNLSKNIKLISAYNYVGLGSTYRVDAIFFDSSATYTTHQNSLYLSPVLYLGKGWTVAPAGHITHFAYKSYRRAYETGTPTNTIDTVSITQYYGGLEVAKRFTGGSASLAVGVSNLAGQLVHADVGLLYYPLGNTNLYGITHVLALRDSIKPHFAITQKVGFKMAKKLWVELGFAKGLLRYFVEGNGFTIYNIPDEITTKLSATLNYYHSSHVNMFVGYTYMQRQGSYRQSFGAGNAIDYNTYYNNHFITTGITFTP
ncbi:MAG: tetratricopeptide repeat protein [Sphingobacteriales bacterium JAD_PAG50586_3]|nr:MAG: tetratricopeptide repeat protein [Sphingobacteriales bacterium JAD_PAG50586_3]